jgi:hypothetical protein
MEKNCRLKERWMMKKTIENQVILINLVAKKGPRKKKSEKN